MPNLFGIDIAGIIQESMGSLLLDATLVKVTNGGRATISSGYSEVLTNYPCKGMISAYAENQIDGTLVRVGDRRILLLAKSITADNSVEPLPGDKISIEGRNYRIVSDGYGVKRDPAAATYVAHCRATASGTTFTIAADVTASVVVTASAT